MENDVFKMDQAVLEPLTKGSDFLVVVPRRKSSSFHDEDLQNLFYLMIGVLVGLVSWHWVAAFGIGLVIFAFIRGIFDERAVLPLSDQSRFMKIRAGRAYSRFYYLDKDLKSLKYKGSRKFQCLQGQIEAINVHEIAEIQDVCDTEVSRTARSHGYSEENCLVLVFDVINGRSLDLVAKSRDVKDQWAAGLRLLLLNERKKCHWDFLEKIFQEVDSNEDGLITFEEAMEVLRRLNIGLQPIYGKDLFNNENIEKTPSKDGPGSLTMKQLTNFICVVCKRPEIVEIFDKLSDRKRIINAIKFKQFMDVDQLENTPIEESIEVIRTCDKCPHDSMCMGGFNSYLLSERAMIFNYNHRTVYQDMSRPLNHYFIATSHNTYLLKDQIKGPSSVDGYIRALQKGCKCLELDCWDGPNNEPIIYHGHTLTSKILFKDVIEGINKFAFTVSRFPVILSFENHCSVDQQIKMATHLKNIFGDKLVCGSVTKDMTTLPSPESLKGKILIKGKKLPSSSTVDELSEDEEDDYGELKAAMGDISPIDVNGVKNGDDKHSPQLNTSLSKESDDMTDGEVGMDDNSGGDGGDENENVIPTTQQKKSSSALKMMKQVLSTNRSNSKDGGGEQTTKSEKTKKKKIKVAKELSDLVVWCQSLSFQSFKQCKERHKFYNICSFEEKKALKQIKNEAQSFVQFNQRQLSRIYPAGHRVDSSNYSPEALWNVGCQLVALNYQTAGIAMELNQGKFYDNGRCGYLLKPEYMRQDNSTFDPRLSGEEHQSSIECHTLKLRIISGYQLPKIENAKYERDIFVSVRVYGVDADSQKARTKTVRSSGFNPLWYESIELKIWRPELALVKFSVKEGENSKSSKQSGTQIGHFILPFQSIMKGYRHIPLFSKSGEHLENALVFVHVDILNDSNDSLRD